MKAIDLVSNQAEIIGPSQTEIAGITLDSRKVSKGELFVALKGFKDDGVKYIQNALESGAVAVAVEEKIDLPSVTQIVDPNLRKNLSIYAARFYDHPTQKLTVIGVTGTNGKTTTSVVIQQVLSLMGLRAGYIGTLGVSYQVGQYDEGERTTPESTDLQRIFKKMVEKKMTHVVLECSSHGIDLGRLDNIEYDVCVFTNLTQDHLDYHKTMVDYAETKFQLFSKLLKASHKKSKTAIFNVDDEFGLKWSKTFDSTKVLTYGIKSNIADVCVENLKLTEKGSFCTVNAKAQKHDLSTPLCGDYNVENILAVIATGHALKLDSKKIIKAMANIEPIPGRLELVKNNQKYAVFIDYAHTDDAFEKVLRTLKNFCRGKLMIIFGCGGDRDKTKRPKMALAASKFADVIGITSDNPRSENPLDIIQDIKKGLPKHFKFLEKNEPFVVGSYFVEPQRNVAIFNALEQITESDVLLIAGKGNETYQEIHGIKHPYSDKKVVEEFLQ